jgi:biotin carboxyl carrier protein
MLARKGLLRCVRSRSQVVIASRNYSYTQSNFSTTVNDDPLHTRTLLMPEIMANTEGTVLEWIKSEGESITEGESICRVEIGDMLLEIESPFNGLIANILVEQNVPLPVNSELVIVCDGKESYMSYFENSRIAAQEEEMARVIAESQAEREVKPSATIVLKEIRHMLEMGILDRKQDLTFIKSLQSLVRKENNEILTAFDSSFEGIYFNTNTFDAKYFIEQARDIVEDFEQNH